MVQRIRRWRHWLQTLLIVLPMLVPSGPHVIQAQEEPAIQLGMPVIQQSGSEHAMDASAAQGAADLVGTEATSPQLLFLPLVAQTGQQTHADMEVREGREVILVADDNPSSARVPLPDVYLEQVIGAAVTFTINYNPASCNGNIMTWPEAARTAFTHAATIWSLILNGAHPIEIDACWRTGMDAGELGSAGARDLFRNFTNAPQSSTWYSVALANQRANRDLNGDTAEIRANFNSTFNWYYGLDGNPGVNQYDFVSVVLHEIGHGLGFADSMSVDNGTAPAECNGTARVGCWSAPTAYDRFLENGANQSLIALGNNTLALGNALTSNSVFFDGPRANAANGGNRPRLYAPTTWDNSGIAHLDENTFNSTTHALMTPFLARAESAHYPGAISLGILQDMGWNVPNLTVVYVNRNATGNEDGSSTRPFNSVLEGVSAVPNNGTVFISSGSYPERLTIERPMTLASAGVVTLGQ